MVSRANISTAKNWLASNGHASPKRLKVALVGAYPIRPDRIANGVEAVVVYLTEGLMSIPEIDLTIISTRDDIGEAFCRTKNGYTIHFLPATRRLGNLTLGALEKRRVIKLLKTIAPDVVHVHNHALYPFISSPQTFPTVTTIHGFVFKESQFNRERLDFVRRWARLALETVVFRRVRNLIAVSSYVRSTLSSKTAAKVSVIDNPVSTAFFGAFNHDVSGRLLFAGTITRRKNLLDLMRSIVLLRPQVPNIELRVAGAFTEPSYAEEVRAFVEEAGMQGIVSFLGHLTEDELLAEYETCQLVVSASHEETAGMIFQQAMAAGKPVVATRVGGVQEIVRDGQTGLLVNPGDCQGLAYAISSLLKAPDLRYQFAANARKEAEHRFRPDVVARRTYELYLEIIGWY